MGREALRGLVQRSKAESICGSGAAFNRELILAFA